MLNRHTVVSAHADSFGQPLATTIPAVRPFFTNFDHAGAKISLPMDTLSTNVVDLVLCDL